MALTRLPDNIPAPLLAGYAIKRPKNTLRTTMDAGTARQRQRFASAPSSVPLSWLLSSDQLSLLEGFIEYTLAGGVAWFEMDLKTSQGITPHQVRFLMDSYAVKAKTTKFWSVSATVEVQAIAKPSEETTTNQALAPGNITEFTDGIDSAVNNYLPGE